MLIKYRFVTLNHKTNEMLVEYPSFETTDLRDAYTLYTKHVRKELYYEVLSYSKAINSTVDTDLCPIKGRYYG